jgi:hypothetical protein
VCDENQLAGMKMFHETLTFCETSCKILDIYVSAALLDFWLFLVSGSYAPVVLMPHPLQYVFVQFVPKAVEFYTLHSVY